MQRNILCVGDPPETGGAVLPHVTSPPHQIHGRQVAVIGGQARCLACKSVGVIAKAGNPYRYHLGGEQVALDQDILICNCSTPPRMLALHAITANVQDDIQGRGAPRLFASTAQPGNQAAKRYDEFFVARDQATGKPFNGFIYGLKTPSGEHHAELYDDGATAKAYAEASFSRYPLIPWFCVG